MGITGWQTPDTCDKLPSLAKAESAISEFLADFERCRFRVRKVAMMNAGRKATVLIVEDEALIRMAVVDLLIEAGFEVLEAGSADEALTILSEQGAADLLFSDVNMQGGMDGLELALAAHERWPGMQLLLTSGRDSLCDERIPDHGKFLRKPWTPEELIAKVRGVLEP